jgi:hypothetical protein
MPQGGHCDSDGCHKLSLCWAYATRQFQTYVVVGVDRYRPRSEGPGPGSKAERLRIRAIGTALLSSYGGSPSLEYWLQQLMF